MYTKKMKINKIKKVDLIDSVHESTKIEKKDIQIIVDSFLDELKSAMENGNNIELRGFGTFELKLRKGRSNARNPKTDELVSVASRYAATFRAGQELKNSLRLLPVDDVES